MSNQNTFSNLYQNKLLPHLKDFEKERKFLIKFAIVAISFILMTCFMIFLSAKDIEDDKKQEFHIIQHLFFIVFFSPIIISVWLFFYKKYINNFKNKIVEVIIYTYKKDWAYSKNGSISKRLFNESKLFFLNADQIDGEDLIKGYVGDTDFLFSEIKAFSQSKKNKLNPFFFKGIFFSADFHKEFSGTTIILPDKAEKHLGKIGQLLQKYNIKRGDLIKLEDPEFEKEFVVYGTDQIEARYIITPKMMRQILSFKRELNIPIYISFVRNDMNICFNHRKNLFEPSLLSPVINPDLYRGFIYEIMFFQSIVEKMNLNTRIWTKH